MATANKDTKKSSYTFRIEGIEFRKTIITSKENDEEYNIACGEVNFNVKNSFGHNRNKWHPVVMNEGRITSLGFFDSKEVSEENIRKYILFRVKGGGLLPNNGVGD